MDVVEKNLEKYRNKVQGIIKEFNTDSWSKEQFDSWVKNLIQEYYNYQIFKATVAKETPKTP